VTNVDVLLSPPELHYLGGLVEGPMSGLAPFDGFASGEVDLARLTSTGLLRDEALSEAGRATLGILGHADASAGFVLAEGDSVREHAVYFAGGAAASLASDGEQVRLQVPPPALADLLGDAIGAGDAVALPFEALFTTAEACVFLASVDIQRRRILQSILDDGEPSLSATDLGTLREWITRTTDSTQWLAPTVRAASPHVIDAGMIEAAATSLAADGVIERGAGGVAPTAVVSALAHCFLVLQAFMRLRAARVTDGVVHTIDIRIAQSQQGHHLLWETDAQGRVHLATLSPTEVTATIEQILTNSGVLEG
jgi:hypothetical protein